MPDGSDAGQVTFLINERLKKRIGAKDYLRNMEGVTREYEVSFGHPDVKRAFERFFYFMASEVHVISVIGRTRLPDEVIALVEKQLRDMMDKAAAAIGEDLDACGALMQASGITETGKALAPLSLTVKVTSPIMRRYLDLLQKCDQLELMLDTLVIEEVVTVDRAESQKRQAKAFIRKVPLAARQWVVEIRGKMQELLAQQELAAAEKLARRRTRKASKRAGAAPDEASTHDDSVSEDASLSSTVSPA